MKPRFFPLASLMGGVLWQSAPNTVHAAPPADVRWQAAGIDWTTPPLATDDLPFVPPTPHEFSLSSGMRVIVVERHTLPLVSVQLLCHDAGAISATPGLANLTGELLPLGAGAYDRDAFAERLETLGAIVEVTTGRDGTTIEARALRATLEPTLELMAQMLSAPRLDPEDFTRTKASLLEQIGRRDQEPRTLATFLWYRLVFGAVHSYGDPVEGMAQSVRPLTLEQVRTYFQGHYDPRHSTLIIVGDVDARELPARLEVLLAGWQTRPVSAQHVTGAMPAITPAPPALYVFDKPGAPQSVVMIGSARAPYPDATYQQTELVNTALGGSFASRLNSRLREELGYTYGINSRLIRLAGATGFLITSSLKSATTVDGIREILAILARTRTTPLPMVEFEKTKKLMARSAPQDFETNRDIAELLRKYVMQGRPLTALATLQTDIRAVDAGAAQRAVAALWDPPIVVVVGDRQTMGDLTSLGLRVNEVNAQGEVNRP